MRAPAALLLLALGGMPAAAPAGPRPVTSMFTTCFQLGPGLTPADSTTWFDAAKHPQVVFYAHMLFPLKPGQDSRTQPEPAEAWHPPMAWPPPAAAQSAASIAIADSYFAEAEWLDPDGAVVAHYGLTMPARVSGDYVQLGGRQYIPHTFTMTIGTKDVRTQAGQKQTPGLSGQYHVRFYVDGELEGIAFFRMLSGEKKEGAAKKPPLDDALKVITDELRKVTGGAK